MILPIHHAIAHNNQNAAVQQDAVNLLQAAAAQAKLGTAPASRVTRKRSFGQDNVNTKAFPSRTIIETEISFACPVDPANPTTKNCAEALQTLQTNQELVAQCLKNNINGVSSDDCKKMCPNCYPGDLFKIFSAGYVTSKDKQSSVHCNDITLNVQVNHQAFPEMATATIALTQDLQVAHNDSHKALSLNQLLAKAQQYQDAKGNIIKIDPVFTTHFVNGYATVDNLLEQKKYIQPYLYQVITKLTPIQRDALNSYHAAYTHDASSKKTSQLRWNLERVITDAEYRDELTQRLIWLQRDGTLKPNEEFIDNTTVAGILVAIAGSLAILTRRAPEAQNKEELKAAH